jgi:hypothetical protein
MPRLALVVLVVLAGCGGGADGSRAGGKASPAPPARAATPSPTATPSPARHRGPVTAAEEAVIRGWSDALRRGDVDAAVRFWATPAVAANGGPPVRLPTARAVRFFNETLPCGAKLLATERKSGYIVATFVLTERPGPGECGSGTGHRARTAFVLRDGKIAQWLRAPDPDEPSDAPGESTA